MSTSPKRMEKRQHGKEVAFVGRSGVSVCVRGSSDLPCGELGTVVVVAGARSGVQVQRQPGFITDWAADCQVQNQAGVP